MTSTDSRLDVFFSPRGGCTDAIVAEIGKAKSNVLVMAYSFTSDRIAGALADADRRGVNARLIVDGGKDEERGGDLHVPLVGSDGENRSTATAHSGASQRPTANQNHKPERTLIDV